MKALVINHYAGNKGDRAVLYFVLRELARNGSTSITVSAHQRLFWPNAITVEGEKVRFVSWGQLREIENESQFLKSFAVRATNKLRREYFFPILKYLVTNNVPRFSKIMATSEFWNALNEADVVIGTGGHHIQTRFTSESISSLTYDMALALLARKPLFLWSQTIGPLNFRQQRNQRFIRKIVDSSQEVYVRDKSSIFELRKIGAQMSHVWETFDSVIGLNDEISLYLPVKERDVILGISVYSAESRTSEVHEKYISSLAKFVDFAASSGYKIRFFPMEMEGAVVDDRACIQDVLKVTNSRKSCEVVEQDLDTVSHLKEVAKCQLFLGHKTHSQVFALTSGVPLIALAYHDKTIDFMQQYGLRANCIRDSELSGERLIEAFKKICSKLEETAFRQYELSRKYGDQVRRSFANMLMRFKADTQLL